MATTETREGPTPNGGVRSAAYYMDDEGNPADKAVATAVEFVEFDAEGREIFRTYGRLRPEGPPAGPTATEREQTMSERQTQGPPPKLTLKEVKVLAALAGANAPLTRQELSKALGITKGWSRLLGAATKDDLGAAGSDSLEGRGLIQCDKPEGERPLRYTITPAGREALAAAK